MFYNKQIIKYLFKKDRQAVEFDYFCYIVARKYFAFRSGIFSLNELLDVFHKNCGKKSLHNKPGNDRCNWKKRLRNRLGQSILFEKLGEDKYKIRSKRKILSLIGINYVSKSIEVKDEDLQTTRNFINICIGQVIDGGQLLSYDRASKMTGYTSNRIYKAVKDLGNSNRIKKYNNIIVDENKIYTLSQVNRLRTILLRIHGIRTPEPLEYNDQYFLGLYGPNSYESVVQKANKRIEQPTLYLLKEKCWIIPLKDRYLRSQNINCNLWVFNQKFMTIDDYIAKYGVGEIS